MSFLRRLLIMLFRWLLYMRATELTRIVTHPGVDHGERVRLTGKVSFGSEPFLVKLGSEITIGDGVRFLPHDGGARIFRMEQRTTRLRASARSQDP